MSEKGYNEYVEKIEDLEKFLEERFKTNAREHKKTNDHLTKLNGKIEKQEAWQNQQEPTLQRWKEEEQNKRSRTHDYLVKVIGGLIVGAALTLISIMLGTNYI